MSRNVITACLALFLWGNRPARGDEAVSPVPSREKAASDHSARRLTEDEVAGLVGQLSSDRLAERTEALRQLIAAGPAILPWLPSEDETSETSHRDTLRRLREQLSRDLARQAIEPTKLAWALDATLKDRWALIQAETSEAFAAPESWPAAVASLSTDSLSTASAKVMSLWNAVETIESETGFRWLWNADLEKFSPVKMDEAKRRAISTSGLFRLILEKPRLQAVPASDIVLLRCEARLQAEPKLRPLLAQVRMSQWSGHAGATPLVPWSPQANYELTFPERNNEVTQTFDFIWPPSHGKSWSLHGRASVLLMAGREAFRFSGPRLARRQSQRRGAVQVTIRDARFSDGPAGQGEARIRIVVNYDQGGPAFESYRVLLFHRSAWLSTKNAPQIAPSGFEVTAEQDGGLEIEYLFSDLTARPIDYTFTYEAPTLLMDVPAEFHFADLAAPASANTLQK